MNIICKLFGHNFPKHIGCSFSLLDDYSWYKCSRCSESGFGKDPFAQFGGKEKFYSENRKPKNP